MDGVLVLEDGRFFRGDLFGATPGLHGSGEVVFNTSLTGYQEILTDPSYEGQIVTLTYPHIGNYGVNAEDLESGRVRAAGLLVRDLHATPSSWRADGALHAWLREAGVPGLGGLDTRALTLHLRTAGALRGVIRPLDGGGADLPLGGQENIERPTFGLEAGVAAARAVPSMAGLDLAERVTCAQPWTAGAIGARLHVVAMDFGVKRNIVRQLVAVGCRVTVVPASTSAADILDLRPDGVLLSNGPGDPEPLTYAVTTVRDLLGRVPLFGICLGHQLLGLACGGRTYKLPFGHRGANHPVRDVDTGRVEITSQNHGFAVAASSLDGREVAVSHTSLFDDTVEGLRHKRHAAFSVQFHPEASPGPHDSHHLFQRFVAKMERGRP
ncbi:MAG: carbamoyl-phosphate synthase small subunit [Myxococcales bacterium]|nr:carbamoyl-phosphate synthase small subunit [Myxococcales bacterium]